LVIGTKRKEKTQKKTIVLRGRKLPLLTQDKPLGGLSTIDPLNDM